MNYNKIRQYYNYGLIGLVSFVALCFFPFLGSEVGMAWLLPTTALSWTIYIVKNLFVAGINMLIFHCFVCQGKINIRDNEKFKEANIILDKCISEHIQQPRSPRQYLTKTYGIKGTAVIICSMLAAVSLTEAILVFDAVALLTYGITLFFGFVTGLLQMAQVEIYWTEEYYNYAKKIERDMAMAEATSAEPQDDTANNIGGTTVLVPTDNNNNNGTVQSLPLGDSDSSVCVLGTSATSNPNTTSIDSGNSLPYQTNNSL